MPQTSKAKKIQIELKKAKAKSVSNIDLSNVKGYNLKLRKSEKIRNAEFTKTKNGKPAIRGVGSDGTEIWKFIKNN